MKDQIFKFIQRNQFFITVFLILIILFCSGILLFLGRSEGRVEIINSDNAKEILLKVDIEGAVKNPGVYSLKPEDRVEDAIKAAGGPLPEADLSKVSKSLAAKVVDGERIIVPFFNNYNSGEQDNSSEKININTASLEELDKLPGIGPSTAQKIIDYREQNGGFESIEEIMEVSGIGESKFEKIKDLITI